MKILFYLIVLSACTISCHQTPTANSIHEGQWTGGLSPVNHPDRITSLEYNVEYVGGNLFLSILGPEEQEIVTRNLTLQKDTLRFIFDEPEENVPLYCILGKQEIGNFSGRCTDDSGKWAHFVMNPPDA